MKASGKAWCFFPRFKMCIQRKHRSSTFHNPPIANGQPYISFWIFDHTIHPRAKILPYPTVHTITNIKFHDPTAKCTYPKNLLFIIPKQAGHFILNTRMECLLILRQQSQHKRTLTQIVIIEAQLIQSIPSCQIKSPVIFQNQIRNIRIREFRLIFSFHGDNTFLIRFKVITYNVIP